MSTFQDKYDLPPGIPQAVKISAAAAALNMPERTVRGWCETGKLEYKQLNNSGARYILTYELVRLEQEGLPVAWETLIT